jgi:hypothetical protein
MTQCLRYLPIVGEAPHEIISNSTKGKGKYFSFIITPLIIFPSHNGCYYLGKCNAEKDDMHVSKYTCMPFYEFTEKW